MGSFWKVEPLVILFGLPISTITGLWLWCAIKAKRSRPTFTMVYATVEVLWSRSARFKTHAIGLGKAIENCALTEPWPSSWNSYLEVPLTIYLATLLLCLAGYASTPSSDFIRKRSRSIFIIHGGHVGEFWSWGRVECRLLAWTWGRGFEFTVASRGIGIQYKC